MRICGRLYAQCIHVRQTHTHKNIVLCTFIASQYISNIDQSLTKHDWVRTDYMDHNREKREISYTLSYPRGKLLVARFKFDRPCDGRRKAFFRQFIQLGIYISTKGLDGERLQYTQKMHLIIYIHTQIHIPDSLLLDVDPKVSPQYRIYILWLSGNFMVEKQPDS